MQHLHCRSLAAASEEVASGFCLNYSLADATTSFSSKDSDCPAMQSVGFGLSLQKCFSVHTETFLILKGI